MVRRVCAIALGILLIGGVVGFAVWREWSHREDMKRVEHALIMLVSKQDMTLRLINYEGKEIFRALVATGANPGNKRKASDLRTPEGVFQVVDIQNSSEWKHDFKDGKGEIVGSYGSHFIRLDVPGHKGIGIHGTHLPESIGMRATEGCIRLCNEDLERLVSLIYPPLTVVITPAAEDEAVNGMNEVK